MRASSATSEAAKRVPRARHSLGAGTTSRSFETESWSYVQHKDFQVHVVQKVEKTAKNRPTIPTTEMERLSFLRGYATTPFKLQIVYLQQIHYSTFFFMYVWNVVLRSISTNYIHVFLSAYDPSEHLYGSKMLPICLGVSWQVVVCGLLQLVASVDVLSMLLAYGLGWLTSHTSWWTCPKNNKLPPNPVPYQCHDLKTFFNICHTFAVKDGVRNEVALTGNFYRWNITDEHRHKPFFFTAAPMHHFMQTWTKTSVLEYKSYSWIIYFAILWVAAGAFYKQLFRKYIWKLCHRLQMFLQLFCLTALLFIEWKYLEVDVIDMSRIYSKKIINKASKWDLDFVAETMTGPPVIHMLYSRCPQEVSPGLGSTFITISNSLMYFFKSLVNYKLKRYTESVYKAPISVHILNPYPIFYFWPFFFGNNLLGNVMLRVFYLTTFIAEFFIFVITYQLLVEVMVCEWSLTRRWAATALISAIGLVCSVAFSTMTKSMAYCITTAISGLTEVVVVCWLYPLGRLLDDAHFRLGAAPSLARRWGLRLLPFYYIYKTYTMLDTLFCHDRAIKARNLRKPRTRNIMEDTSATKWLWVIPVVPLPLGVLYAIIKYIVLEKQNWHVILKPRPDWGPQDHVTRQLRKQFDNREYVNSQAPRFLSRHMLAKAQTPTYRLDIRYDDAGAARRSTVVADQFKYNKLDKYI